MANKTANFNLRMDPEIKGRAEELFSSLTEVKQTSEVVVEELPVTSEDVKQSEQASVRRSSVQDLFKHM